VTCRTKASTRGQVPKVGKRLRCRPPQPGKPVVPSRTEAYYAHRAEALCFKSEADCDMRSSLPHVRTLAAKHATNPSKSYLFFKVCSRSLCAYHVHICMRYVHLFFEFLFACVHQASASTTSLTIRPYICICCARTYQLTVLNSSSLRAPRVLAPAAVQTLRPLAAAPAAAFHSIF